MSNIEENSEKVMEELQKKNKELYAQFSSLKNDVDEMKTEKENVLDKMKEKDMDLAFYKNLVGHLLSKDQQKIVKNYWARNRFQIPAEIFVNKEIRLPNLMKFVGTSPSPGGLNDEDDDDGLFTPMNIKTYNNPSFNNSPGLNRKVTIKSLKSEEFGKANCFYLNSS